MGWIIFYIITVTMAIALSLIMFAINRSDYNNFKRRTPDYSYTQSEIDHQLERDAKACVFWARFFFTAPVWPIGIALIVLRIANEMQKTLTAPDAEVKTSGTTQYVGSDRRRRRTTSTGPHS